MEIKKRFREEYLDFYSDEMIVTKKVLIENHLKLTYLYKNILKGELQWLHL